MKESDYEVPTEEQEVLEQVGVEEEGFVESQQ